MHLDKQPIKFQTPEKAIVINVAYDIISLMEIFTASRFIE